MMRGQGDPTPEMLRSFIHNLTEVVMDWPYYSNWTRYAEDAKEIIPGISRILARLQADLKVLDE